MSFSEEQLQQMKSKILHFAQQLGFQDARVSDTVTGDYFTRFKDWVEQQYHGDMSFLERNQDMRQSPAKLHPNTLRVISLRYDYLPENAGFTKPLKDKALANVSRYALGRDYHKLIRKKLNMLCQQLSQKFQLDDEFDYRVFVDSAPVLETSFAEKSGLGWKGKHSLIINKNAGSWFFLGEIFINIPLPIDESVENLCGNCTACISLCPTDAIIDNKTIDATRCISYLTIENKGAIPEELRPKMGNRIYGCDDCQLACPWNRYAAISAEKDFQARHNLDSIDLLSLWQWNENEFNDNFQGSPIRRIGYQNWLRNLAVALGNSDYQEETIIALQSKKAVANNMVNEHIDWAIANLKSKQSSAPNLKTKKLINCVQTMLARDA